MLIKASLIWDKMLFFKNVFLKTICDIGIFETYLLHKKAAN